MELLESDEIGKGFQDEMYKAGCADAAWEEAIIVIAEATGAEPEYVRAFLESYWGRRFGVTVREFLRSRFLQSAVRAAAACLSSIESIQRPLRGICGCTLIPFPKLLP